MRKSKDLRVPRIDKLPLVESVYRWIDVYTYLHYPNDVRLKAYEVLECNNKLRGFPHFLAACAVFRACEVTKTAFDSELMSRITVAHRMNNTPHSALDTYDVKRKSSTWTLPKQ